MKEPLSINEEVTSSHNLVFWFHVLVTALAWVGPFLFSWYLMVPAYLLVVLQFIIFGRCLLNAQHDLKDDKDTTFYSYLFEKAGVTVNKRVLKLWVRRYIYLILSAVTLIWQVVLGSEPLLF
ncbi:MAG TPA: hypothetical protein DDW81_06315 [Cryomorphaceae bacterium]|nr:hypothetical protein [Owenweeksia sp.]HBF19694.1 hypothetical protein [Cryomorphaceae bacterium]HCQ16545.1 hypothetical protein [Cryomorphaceae bacterium]